MREALHTGMGSAILAHLRSSHELPKHGIVAGGAVHAALEALYARGGAPINDIDVFQRNAITPPEPMPNQVNKTVGFSEPELVLAEGYSHCCHIESHYRYGIKSTTRDGLLNQVYTDLASNRSVKQLLAGFDMNYARCGIDLAVGDLVWQPEFEEFWHGRQLRISRATTPFHSMLRYTRKLEELPDCYGNIEQAQLIAASSWWSLTRDASEAGVLKSALAMQGCRVDERAALQPWFGKKFRDLWDAQQALHRDAFELVAHPIHRDRLWCLRPRDNAPPDQRLHCDLMGLEVTNGAYAAILPQYIYRRTERKSPSLTALWDRLAELQTASGASKFEDVPLGRVLVQHVTGRDYFSKADHPNHLGQVVKFFRQHWYLQNTLAEMPLSEQYRRVELVKRLESRFGLWATGELESLVGPRELLKDGNESALIEYFATRHLHLCRRLLPDSARLPLPAEINGYAVHELVQGSELLGEGERMHHCVGGYGDAVESGHSRIVSLRRGDSPKDWWTAEICNAAAHRPIEPGARLTIRQLRGMQNVEAPVWLVEALQACLDALPLPGAVQRPQDVGKQTIASPKSFEMALQR